MSVRWEAPGIAARRRSAPEDECEIAMLADATIGANEGDGDHSRSRNGANAGRTTSGGRCPVAMVDAELSDEAQEAEDDCDDGIVVLDEASERLLGKWNGSPKVKMFKSKHSSNEPSPAHRGDPPATDPAAMHIILNPSSQASATPSPDRHGPNPPPTAAAKHPSPAASPPPPPAEHNQASAKSANNNNNSSSTTTGNSKANSNSKTNHSKPTGKGGGEGGGGGGGGGKEPGKPRKGSDEESDIIGELIGDYGKWQFVMTFLLSLFQVPNTFHIYSPTFQAADKSFWCRRPPLLQDVPVDLWRNVTGAEENCRILNYDWNALTSAQLEMSNFSLPKNLTGTVGCDAWEFDLQDNLGNTWSSEWNLVCDKEYLKNVAEMFFLAGVATGGITSGVLSDKFGRKMMLFISAVLQSIFGLALYFADSFEFYLVLRALLGIVSVSVTYAGLILAIEYVDGKWRTIAGMYNLFPLPVSYIMISGIAYLTQDYRNLQLCIGLPGVFLCFLWFVLPESPRWLLCKGRITEVKEVIRKAAAFNKRPLPDNLDKLLKPPVDQEETAAGVCELFRSKYLRLVTFCFLCIWFTMNLVYYGLVLNMNSFGGNIYLNSALAGVVEIPAIALAMYIINRTGKKWLFCATFFAAALACLCAAIVEGKSDLLAMKITFVMIGKFTISAGNTIMPVYTAELYPTAIRNVGVGACNLAAGFALVLTPYLSMLTKIEDHLLMTLLTAWCIFGAIVIVFLPEGMQHHEHEEREEEKEIDTQLTA